MRDNSKFERFKQLAYRCKNRHQLQRLWNWADNQPNPEPYMLIVYAVQITRGYK